MRCILPLVLAAPVAMADVTFSFDYSESAEFMDPTHGPARRAALEDAAEKLGRIFDHTATVTILVTSSNDPTGDTLASAGSYYGTVPGTYVGYVQGIVQEKILTGVDANGGVVDGEVDVNFGKPWDLDDEVSADQFDFKATVIHELVHATGFLSGVLSYGSDSWGSLLGAPGVWELFDGFLSDKDGVRVLDESTFRLDLTAWNALNEGGASPAGGLFFDGPRARAANGGQPVGLYSPVSWESGSSGSHLDDENPVLAGSLMLAAGETGRYRRSLSDIERGILEDLGYSLKPLAPLRLELRSVSAGASAVLDLSGPEDRWYAVERSVNLSDWSAVEVIEMAGGAVTVTAPLVAGETEVFFRLRETDVPAPPTPARSGRARGWR